MKYHCGHDGCDICGTHERVGSIGTPLKKYGNLLACESCVVKAVKLAVHVSESFSTFIDPSKPCEHLRTPMNNKQQGGVMNDNNYEVVYSAVRSRMSNIDGQSIFN